VRVRLFIAFAALGVFTVTADAHHSIAGMYDQGRRVTLDGVIAQYQFVNPHPFIMVDVTMNGMTQSWKAELDNRWELQNIGMTPTTFTPATVSSSAAAPAAIARRCSTCGDSSGQPMGCSMNRSAPVRASPACAADMCYIPRP
jgi:hypothetical protein